MINGPIVAILWTSVEHGVLFTNSRGAFYGQKRQIRFLYGSTETQLGGMKMTRWLWNELRDLFDTDDGSLPEIYVSYRNSAATVSGYALLRGRAARVVSENAYFWSKTHNAEHPLDSVSNAAALVVSGEAESFHVVLGGIKSLSVTIPDLGVSVFSHQLALDYRMGPAWGPKELEALFGLLGELAALDPYASLSLEEGVLADVAARFQNAWQLWAAEHAT